MTTIIVKTPAGVRVEEYTPYQLYLPEGQETRYHLVTREIPWFSLPEDIREAFIMTGKTRLVYTK
jgi:hypothetical protein